MPPTYALTPLLAWLVAGGLKFVVNCLRARRLAFDLIGYGGMPSNHSAIVASMCSLIYFREGNTPALGVAATLAFIVILDATGLRRHMGRHAAAVNRLDRSSGNAPILRERMGHTLPEIGCGLILGAALGWLMAAWH